MSLTNPEASTKIFGFSLPNILIYGLIAIAAYIFFKVGKLLGSVISSIGQKFGLTPEVSAEENSKEIQKIISKDSAIQSQMTLANRAKADQIEACIEGLGDTDALYEIFKTITGPNQMKAIYACFGTRLISSLVPDFFGLNFRGDLIASLNDRLWDYQLNKTFGTGVTAWSIKTKLNWITK